MAWREVSVVDQRSEFVMLASLEGANVSALSKRFGISRQTGYLWLRRAKAGETVQDRSRRPHSSPFRTPDDLERSVVDIRDEHPAWGARKIARRMRDLGMEPPCVSTVHAVLSRHGRIGARPSERMANGRFEREAPNLLWQMDFKGRIQMACGNWCYPLTIIDDHSRFAIAIEACPNEQLETVRARLEAIFRRYGMPMAIYCDNGNPWGAGVPNQWTRLRVWLLKLGIELIHSRPYHPQGRGKNERFHRSLKAEVTDFTTLLDQAHAQKAFDRWRRIYNHHRPHEALGMAVPASRYRPSSRAFPNQLPEPIYDRSEIVRCVSSTKGYVSFKGKTWRVPNAFRNERLAIRSLNRTGLYGVFFGATQVAKINLES
ncbi:IS481 family transposase [Agrobacterium larrymoorei]|uniref:IS481 family transposase n=6 Tax=Agrobacterium larrymoorei TaxID=160699 RepID=A0ABX8T1L6_9HYPH|nr:IS481 family transposase [Agrobacterium larrymoorei]QYA06173.1 IS481 family transposase [Agrobacterium larrymoorei]QYA06206.1 IS481 family transposase [Agrobacterium larrymoorei]QYA07305.1 IS481 family transposase [Agrobacterium larrymoorei]QYA07405.1 IS481 family transposase [Agrobacterium larrymoorei]